MSFPTFWVADPEECQQLGYDHSNVLRALDQPMGRQFLNWECPRPGDETVKFVGSTLTGQRFPIASLESDPQAGRDPEGPLQTDCGLWGDRRSPSRDLVNRLLRTRHA